jgi:bifunctional ADP-heptose synthase (sugar kinase/adenylyltransferase)
LSAAAVKNAGKSAGNSALQKQRLNACSTLLRSSSRNKTLLRKDLEYMLRLAVIDADGHIVAAKDVPTAAELVTLAEQAKAVIRECERLAQLKKGGTPGPGSGTAPYSS